MPSTIISLISGILLSYAFPRADLHWIAWFALAPLFYYTFRLNRVGALASGFAFGLGYFGGLLYWIGVFGKLPWAALTIFQALFIVAFVAAARLVGEKSGIWGRFALVPAVWVVFEWLRSIGMLGFTWGDLGYSQYRALPIVQIASITGVWGVSFILAMTNAALANTALARIDRRRMMTSYTQVLICGLAVLAMIGTGVTYLKSPIDRTGTRVGTAVVQGNFNPDVEFSVEGREQIWETYREGTLTASRMGASLIVWPETAVPGNVGRDGWIQSRLSKLADDANAYLLVGGRSEDIRTGKMLNSAFLIGPGSGVLGEYSKVRLVPFGEYVPRPMKMLMPFLAHYQVTPHDISPGSGYNLLDTGSYKVGTAICFESIFPYIARRLTASGAEVLCVITNDSWFEKTSAAEQHMSKSVFRAVENRRYLLRGAATGVSCIIDPQGRILTRSEIFESTVLGRDVWTRTEQTFYTRHGDWLVFACLGLVLVVAAVRLTAARIGRR